MVVDRQISELRDGFAWESLNKGTVVDAGGGSGHVSISLARVRYVKASTNPSQFYRLSVDDK